jgi:uncharacterized protein
MQQISFFRRTSILGALATLLVAVPSATGCSSDASPVETQLPSPPLSQLAEELRFGNFIWPGRSVGPLRLGMTYAQVKAAIGKGPAFGANNILIAAYPQRGLELVFSSSDATSVSEDARLLSIAATDAVTFSGFATPGELRSAVEARLGPGENTGDTVFYPVGLGIKYDKPGAPDAVAKTVSVFPAYRMETTAPEMRSPFPFPRHNKPIDLTGKRLGVVDMHLHPGFFGRIPASTKPFIVNSVPPFLKPHLPAISGQGLDPWAPHLGIRAQTEIAGIEHAVLFAVYTQKTTGFITNEEIESIVTAPENRTADGLPWAFALASINFFDGYVKDDGTLDRLVSQQRLRALSGYFERRRDLFIGIKLAHAHQGVAFDDLRYLGVYEVAAKQNVPVYLHTGFTPFPAGKNLPAFYDPQGLENTIINYPGMRFVLGHVGQGAPAAVEHSLALAQKYPNVFLEISALNRPLVVDEDGGPVTPDPSKPQYPYVIAQIKARSLIDKTLFGSDGPQGAGTVQKYVGLIRSAMFAENYTAEEIAAVMGGNFQRVYFPTP